METLNLPYRPTCSGCGKTLLTLDVRGGNFSFTPAIEIEIGPAPEAGYSVVTCIACEAKTTVPFRLPNDELLVPTDAHKPPSSTQ